MDRFRRFFELHRILSHRRRAITRQELERELECSRPTLTRLLREARDCHGIPIRFDRERGGYIFDTTEHYEIPGL